MKRYQMHAPALALVVAVTVTVGCSFINKALDVAVPAIEEVLPTPSPTPAPTPAPEPTPQPTPEPVELGVPANLVATAGNERVSLTWEPAANAVAYQVIRQFAVKRLVYGTSYVWGEKDGDRLKNGEEQNFAVRGVDSRGNIGRKSNDVKVTPVAPPPVYRTPTSVRLKMVKLYRAAPGGHMGTGSSVMIVAELRDAAGIVPWQEVDPKHYHQATWRVELAGHAAEARPGPPPRNVRVWWSTDGAACQVATAIAQYNAGRGFAVDILTKDDCCGGEGTLTAPVAFSHPGLGLRASQTYPYVVWDAPEFKPGRKWPPQRK